DSARPNLMDALQELADVVNSDMWVREGLIYPKRRKVAATADATVDDSDFVINSNPMQLKDPQTIYCNVYRALYSADVLSRPTLADDMPPVQIPMGITLIDHDEVKANNSVSTEVDVSRTWWRQHLTASWIQQQKTAQQNSHLADWTAGNEVQFDQRSQSQVWMESTLSHRFAWLEQGDTIAYDVDPYTSRLGQIRDIRISGGDGKPVTMKVRSWHINF
ncbi:hypothetical protein HN937_27590, partial [Candidatus Poribacteria bacterium]|nr:hypothetical protein [Candidatus Poribacteria bacterium]